MQVQEKRSSSLTDVKYAEEAAEEGKTEDAIAVSSFPLPPPPPLLSLTLLQEVTGAIGWDDPNLDKDRVVLEDDSPYPEVRASVSNTDDPDMPSSTLRAWVIGICFAILVPGKSACCPRFLSQSSFQD